MSKTIAIVGIVVLLALGGFAAWHTHKEQIKKTQHEVSETVVKPRKDSEEAADAVKDSEERIEEQMKNNNN